MRRPIAQLCRVAGHYYCHRHRHHHHQQQQQQQQQRRRRRRSSSSSSSRWQVAVWLSGYIVGYINE